jgi:hypothetical protein
LSVALPRLRWLRRSEQFADRAAELALKHPRGARVRVGDLSRRDALQVFPAQRSGLFAGLAVQFPRVPQELLRQLRPGALLSADQLLKQGSGLLQ